MKKYKPVTPSLRHRIIEDRSFLDNIKPEKNLVSIIKKKGGRNFTGKITCRHRGGGHKRKLRFIELNTPHYCENIVMVSNEYDPNRSSYITRCYNKVFKPSYRLKSQDNKLDEVKVLKDIKPGTDIYNINKFSRAGGTYSKILNHIDDITTIRLPSKKVIQVKSNILATIGKSSNNVHKLVKEGKAGALRWKGRRPVVRGYAQNPVDHPHGGKTSGGFQPKTKWGKYAKWVKK